MRVGDSTPYTLNEAKTVIAAYCFAEVAIRFRPPGGPFGDVPSGTRPMWAWATFDEIPPGSDQPDVLGDLDAFVVAGLNAPMNVSVLGSLRAIAGDVGRCLASDRIPDGETFWELPRDELLNPREGSVAWWMRRAWWLCMAAPGVGVTTTHKYLHHKRPRLFPIIDQQTRVHLTQDAEGGNLWVRIYDDLAESQDEFEHLEAWFDELRKLVPGSPLYRLRMHDILLWCRAIPRNFDQAMRHGESIMRAIEEDRWTGPDFSKRA